MSATRSFEGSSPCSAPVSTIWQVWTTPSAWPGGIIESASIDGDFVVVAKYTTKVKGLPASTGTVTHVESPRIWGSVAKAPGLTLTYEQAVRLWACHPVLCRAVLESLVESRFLVRTRRAAFVRSE